MRQIFFLVLLLTAVLNAKAQNAVVEESSTDVECFSPTQAIIHFREVTTILNEHGAGLAVFVCSCSKNNKLTGFKGQAADATGRVSPLMTIRCILTTHHLFILSPSPTNGRWRATTT